MELAESLSFFAVSQHLYCLRNLFFYLIYMIVKLCNDFSDSAFPLLRTPYDYG